MDPTATSPKEALERFFGERSFRPGQREAIDAALAGRDALVVLPTGAGKPLVYQIAALLLPGTVVVVSPLIALMRDQLDSLCDQGYPGVAVLHSDIAESEQRATVAALQAGRIRLLYLTPERCASEEFLTAASHALVALFAVDEAHCISEWGHDFRPSYLLLVDATRVLGRPPVVAPTATAASWVRDEITQGLGMRVPRCIVRGFDRPNLFYEVYVRPDDRAKHAALEQILVDTVQPSYAPPLGPSLAHADDGAGIVYTALTRSARELSQWLNRRGVHAAYCHGQLKAGQRTAVHESFRDGAVRAVAATYAFGMGIDRADLRYVAHYDAPASIEAYHQSRAGPDATASLCAVPCYSLKRTWNAARSPPVRAPSRGRRPSGCSVPYGARPPWASAASRWPETRALRTLELLLDAGAVREQRGRLRVGTAGGAEQDRRWRGTSAVASTTAPDRRWCAATQGRRVAAASSCCSTPASTARRASAPCATAARRATGPCGPN